MTVGALLFSIPGGIFADGVGAGRGLFLGTAARTAVVACAYFAGEHALMAAGVALAYSAVSQVFSPSELALVSAIGRRHPPGAHAALVALQHGGQGIGILVLAPGAYFIGGAEAMVFTAVAIYLAAIGLSGALSLRTGHVRVNMRPGEALSMRGPVRFFLTNGPAANAGILLGFVEMATKAAIVALPIYVAQELQLGSVEAFALLIPGGLGVLLGLGWAGRALRVEMAPQVMRWTLAGGVLGLLALAVLGNALAGAVDAFELATFGLTEDPVRLSVIVAIPVALLLGLCFSVAPTCSRSVLSAMAPAGEQARVFASQAMLTDILSLAPLLLAGIGTEMYGARATLLAAGAVGAALFVGIELVRAVRGPGDGTRNLLAGHYGTEHTVHGATDTRAG
ncbi:MAG: hypothetical protein U5Q44_16725 [Dehalococcoidia bacterium]|nr:hypothetical protein [Dehalococcoidia bacterium]